MAEINVTNLTFYYEGSYDNIFENVSFQIDTDWKLGFIGRNGRGKTTFLNLLLGKWEYKGSIKSSVTFDYFPYEVGDKTKNSIEIVEEIFPEYDFWKVCRELNLLQVDADVFYRSFDTLSNGEQTKLMLAILFSKENNFLLIDEPTNHLDMPTRDLVMEYLNQKKGFILVSHDRRFIDGCVDHILSINKTNIEVCKGYFFTWYENKQRQDAWEMAENEKLKKDIKRLEESAKQSSAWADSVERAKIGNTSKNIEKNIDTRAYLGEKSRRMQQRRKNLEKRQMRELDEKSKLLKNIESEEVLKILPLTHYKDTLIRIEQLNLWYGEKQVLKEFDLTIKSGERIALCGKNGCGKSSIIKAILLENQGIAQNMTVGGRIEMASGLIISYVPQDTSYLKGTLTEFAAQRGIEESLFKTLLRKLDFERLSFEKRMEEYSEGQKKKVLIAGSLCERAHLYIWDEPLNFIDIISRIQIEKLLMQYQPTMIFVEHDEVFTEKIATKTINL